MRKYILLFSSLFFLSSLVLAQQIVTGKVTDASGSPLAGVSIKVRSTGNGIITNSGGEFKVTAKSDDVLEISIVGYTSQTVNINGQSEIAIRLEQSNTELSQIVLVGTRRPGRVRLETPVPVDVVNVGTASMPTARMDLTSIINYAAPSFNYNKQSGSDGADHIDLATLRGLGPDQTLVLINGKRRHQTAFVSVFGTRGRGNSGTDLNAIPVSAIERVEILRDGASAQYGSDAIAGVINLILKKSTGEFSGNVGYSGYYDKKYNPHFKKSFGQYISAGAVDGNTITVGANYGVPVGKNDGFINFSMNFLSSGKTFRQVSDTNKLFTNDDALPINTVRRANGDGSMNEIGGFFNSEIPVGRKSTTFYAFGGYNYKSADAYAFTRSFSARPERFVTGTNGTLINVPGIIMTSSDGEKFFNPHIQTKVSDASLSAGIKGVTDTRWVWDFSNTLGRNNFHFYGDKTFNASLGDPNKNHFDDGGFSFLQNTVNLNFSKELAGVAQGFNLALGAEYRYENYKMYAGEEASYKNYNANKATGSQGFPGYQPADVVSANRSNIGAYVDAEMDVTTRFLLEGAIRVENYNDFGFTHNYKLATRVKATDRLNLRGSISTGFRAPSLQQINFSSTFTTVQGGNIAEVKIAPNANAITKAAGIPELKQEKSVNASLGFTLRPCNELSITIDGYLVKIKNRVVLSGQFSADDNTLNPALLTALHNLHVSLAQFFANAVNTTNKGIDFVIDYNKRWGNKNFKALFTANVQNMQLDKINVPDKLNDTKDHRQTFLSDREQKFILASAPNSKFGLNLEHGLDKFTVGTRISYFGKITLLGYGQDGLGINPTVPTDINGSVNVKDEYIYHGKAVTDLYFSYKLSSNISAFIGADNLFNVHPDFGAVKKAKYWAYNNEPGGPWDAVQMGANGIRFFARLGLSF